MDERLRAALQPVLADVRATTDIVLEVGEGNSALSEEGWLSVLVRTPDGSATGISIPPADWGWDLNAHVAGAVQEIVIEELWARASNWPRCPEHPTTHPMTLLADDDALSWGCPATQTTHARLGSLVL